MDFSYSFFLFVWYLTEYACYIAIIAYVLYTFKVIQPYKMKNDVPATLGQTWNQTNNLLSTAVDIATKFRNVIDKTQSGGNSNPSIAN